MKCASPSAAETIEFAMAGRGKSKRRGGGRFGGARKAGGGGASNAGGGGASQSRFDGQAEAHVENCARVLIDALPEELCDKDVKRWIVTDKGLFDAFLSVERTLPVSMFPERVVIAAPDVGLWKQFLRDTGKEPGVRLMPGAERKLPVILSLENLYLRSSSEKLPTSIVGHFNRHKDKENAPVEDLECVCCLDIKDKPSASMLHDRIIVRFAAWKCSHMHVCSDCMSELASEYKPCPVCRAAPRLSKVVWLERIKDFIRTESSATLPLDDTELGYMFVSGREFARSLKESGATGDNAVEVLASFAEGKSRATSKLLELPREERSRLLSDFVSQRFTKYSGGSEIVIDGISRAMDQLTMVECADVSFSMIDLNVPQICVEDIKDGPEYLRLLMSEYASFAPQA